MKLDRFLALLFSKRMIALLLLLVLAVSCLTACEQTIEDILCLYFCGCVSFDTCREMIWACDCDSTACRDDGTTCRQGNCVGESYIIGDSSYRGGTLWKTTQLAFDTAMRL